MPSTNPDQISNNFPHVGSRQRGKHAEPYLLGAGAAVWEVAWLARLYGNDTEAVSRHLVIDLELVAEALSYSRSHPEEVDRSIREVEEASAEQVAQKLPSLQVITVDEGSKIGPPSWLDGVSCWILTSRKTLWKASCGHRQDARSPT